MSLIIRNLIRKSLNKNLFILNPNNRVLFNTSGKVFTLFCCSYFKERNSYDDSIHDILDFKYVSTSNLLFQQKPKAIAERNYFDTNLFIKELQNEGFTQQQAECLCRVFKEINTYVINDVKSECVTRSFQVNFK